MTNSGTTAAIRSAVVEAGGSGEERESRTKPQKVWLGVCIMGAPQQSNGTSKPAPTPNNPLAPLAPFLSFFQACLTLPISLPSLPSPAPRKSNTNNPTPNLPPRNPSRPR